MDSIWTKTARLPQFPSLAGVQKTDVLIVGGGIAGLLCAYLLDQAGVDYLLVEARRICSGITKNTTAKLTVQHGLCFDKLLRTYGPETARLYLQANQEALETYRTLCAAISCDFTEQDNFVYSLDDPKVLEVEARAMERLDLTPKWAAHPPLPFSVAGALGLGRQAQFHPLKFLAAIAGPLRIFEQTKVLELLPGKAVTDKGTISAKAIVLATHFPILNKHGGYWLKLYQHRSYVLALKNPPPFQGMYVDSSQTGMSFRTHQDLLLVGGGGHRTGKSGGGWRELEDFARRHYPQSPLAARWAAQDCMTLDGLPYVGQYARSTPNLYVITGFQKWGMTSAMASSMLLTRLLQGKDSPYTQVFDPSRRMLHPQLAANALASLTGMLTPTRPRCPHMGCALKYNRQEHSWDCPCHGSRFAGDGQLIDNPATDDKTL